uniref:Transmembrane protein n=1 Tax=Akashiwo sanguinea TaxID=143672 RepID=A0A7S2VWF7_9DINO|mmetsp:Transcript_696/g.402  ORF Transcript_696/g.402 Transcript_696/m.402 type:complete len:109 (+) Transcript_696:259-585(+)
MSRAPCQGHSPVVLSQNGYGRSLRNGMTVFFFFFFFLSASLPSFSFFALASLVSCASFFASSFRSSFFATFSSFSTFSASTSLPLEASSVLAFFSRGSSGGAPMLHFL